MAFIIDTFLTGDKRLQLGNEELVRRMSFGAQWQKVRVGLRLSLNDTVSLISDASLCFGLCEGLNGGFKNEATAAWVGWIPGSYPTSWTRGTLTTATYIFSGLNGQVGVKFGSGLTLTFANMANLTTAIGINPNLYLGATGTWIFADFTKVGTSISVKPWFPYISGVSRTLYEFMVFLGYADATTYSGLNTYGPFTVDYGSTINQLDTLSVVWERSVPTLELSDVAVARFY